jgi:hypothetical protein
VTFVGQHPQQNHTIPRTIIKFSLGSTPNNTFRKSPGVVLLFPVDFITFTFAVVETIYLRGNFLRMLLSSICILERLILATLIYRSKLIKMESAN